MMIVMMVLRLMTYEVRTVPVPFRTYVYLRYAQDVWGVNSRAIRGTADKVGTEEDLLTVGYTSGYSIHTILVL